MWVWKTNLPLRRVRVRQKKKKLVLEKLKRQLLWSRTLCPRTLSQKYSEAPAIRHLPTVKEGEESYLRSPKIENVSTYFIYNNTCQELLALSFNVLFINTMRAPMRPLYLDQTWLYIHFAMATYFRMIINPTLVLNILHSCLKIFQTDSWNHLSLCRTFS